MEKVVLHGRDVLCWVTRRRRIQEAAGSTVARHPVEEFRLYQLAAILFPFSTYAVERFRCIGQLRVARNGKRCLGAGGFQLCAEVIHKEAPNTNRPYIRHTPSLTS